MLGWKMKHVLEDEVPIEQKRPCSDCEYSRFYNNTPSFEVRRPGFIPGKFIEIERTLSERLLELSYSHPVTHIYNPIDYAFPVHSTFVNKFCESEKKIMFLGMNPGPWGMSQTGVPFGEVNIVREWLGITGEVGRPKKENPARPVLGFACSRSEISGQRFWGLFKDVCGEARNFFENTLIYNHCPIAFMTESGRNITPNELKLQERKALTVLCDKALFEVIILYNVSIVIAIGRFAEKRANTILKGASKNDVKVICIPHPSPRNFGTAEKWREIVIAELDKNALMQYFKRSTGLTNLTTSEMLPGSSFGHETKRVEDSTVT